MLLLSVAASVAQSCDISLIGILTVCVAKNYVRFAVTTPAAGAFV